MCVCVCVCVCGGRTLYLEPVTFLVVETITYSSSLLPFAAVGPGFLPTMITARERLDRLDKLPLETARE